MTKLQKTKVKGDIKMLRELLKTLSETYHDALKQPYKQVTSTLFYHALCAPLVFC
jgi:hypothetical protein